MTVGIEGPPLERTSRIAHRARKYAVTLTKNNFVLDVKTLTSTKTIALTPRTIVRIWRKSGRSRIRANWFVGQIPGTFSYVAPSETRAQIVGQLRSPSLDAFRNDKVYGNCIMSY